LYIRPTDIYATSAGKPLLDNDRPYCAVRDNVTLKLREEEDSQGLEIPGQTREAPVRWLKQVEGWEGDAVNGFP